MLRACFHLFLYCYGTWHDFIKIKWKLKIERGFVLNTKIRVWNFSPYAETLAYLASLKIPHNFTCSLNWIYQWQSNHVWSFKKLPVINLIAKLNCASEIERVFREFLLNEVFTHLNINVKNKYAVLCICNQTDVEIFSEACHCIKCARLWVFIYLVVPYKDRIVDSVLIRKNTSQWKPTFLHIFCGVFAS